jgi:hypothetical protein
MRKSIFLFLFCISLFSIDVPKDPTPPSLVEEETKKDSKKEKKTHTVSVQVKLCDGRQLSGSVEYEKEELNIKHTKDGIQYEKKIRVSELRQIKIYSWTLKKQKKNKEGTLFEAKPDKVMIQGMGEEKFYIQGLGQTEFASLKLNNQNGIAKLFSYWSDLQYANGNWYSKLSQTNSSEREDCHPDVIRSILFL